MKKTLFIISVITFQWLSFSSLYAQGCCEKNKESDSTNSWHATKSRNMFPTSDFGILLGLNNWDKAIQTPELNQLGSRFFALDWRHNDRLITGKQVDFALGSGVQIAWNNFMLENDTRFVERLDGTSTLQTLLLPVEKSKLTVARVEIPVLLQVGFKESGLQLGFGVYGGLRVNSYQKLKSSRENEEKIKEDFNLNPFNYGFLAEAGRKSGVKLFAKYDMTNAFRDTNTINGQVFSAGLRF
jgi:hypothetical protein